MNTSSLSIVAALLVIFTPLILTHVRQAQKIRRAIRVGRVVGGAIPPLNYSVEEEPNVDPWVERRAREFEALGFVRVGSFRLAPTCVRATVLLGDDGRTFIEIITEGLLGREVGVTRQNVSGDVVRVGSKAWMPGPPSLRTIHLPRASARKMVECVRAESPTGELLRLTRETYPQHAVRESRRSSEWQLINGPLRPEMIPTLEALTGTAADPEAVELLRRAHEGSNVYPRG